MRLSWVVLLMTLGVGAFAEGLPPMVRDAVQLELDGRPGEALERYRAALSTEPLLVQDDALSLPLTIRVVAKAAHLSIDLGYGDEAWDLGGRLLGAKNRPAAEAGTLIRMRILRLQGKGAEALTLFNAYARDWPQQPPGANLLWEVWRLRTGTAGASEGWLGKIGGPVSWVVEGYWSALPEPADVLGLDVAATTRLQVGAFKDWANALTLIDMLREKGWAPFTEVRTNAAGDKLHVVYLITRQPGSDKARLQAQGLLP